VFDRKKKGPDRPFVHQPDCPILLADPGFEPSWEEVEPGHLQRRCHVKCGSEDFYPWLNDGRPRQDPFDPSTWPVMNHLGGCEYRDETDPAILRAILQVTEVGDYYRVDCRSCTALWRVMYHGEGVG
jgi:hypothetical protein